MSESSEEGKARRSTIAAYGVAVGVTALAVLLRWLLDAALANQLPLVTLFGAVAAAVWFGGYGPAVVAATLGYLACDYLFIEPRLNFVMGSAQNLIGVFAYIVTCSIIIGLGEAMRISQRRFEELAAQQEQLFPPASAIVESVLRKHNLHSLTALGFAVAMALLVVGGAAGYVNTQRLVENERSAGRTQEVIGQSESILSTLVDAETGQRGYLLTEDKSYLEPYEKATARVQSEVARLEELTSDNVEQQPRIGVLKQSIAARFDELQRTVALMQGGDRAAALEIVRQNGGKTLMDNVRDAVAGIQEEERKLSRQRAIESRESTRVTIVSIIVPTAIGTVLVAAVFFLSQRNLAQRQRAAELLAEQRERLRVTLASIGDAVITTDTQGRVTFLNIVAESLTGWKHEQAAGQPLDVVFRIVNEQTRAPVENPALKALREGVIVGLANHTVLIAKDGSELPIDDRASPIKAIDGRVQGCVLVFREITERKFAEQQRADDEARIRAVVDHVVDGIITIDEHGVVESFNLAAQRLFGYSAQEVIGQNVNLLMPDPFHAEHDQYLVNYLSTGQARIIGIGRDVEGRRKDGTVFPMRLAVSEFLLGNRRYFSGIVRDISSEKLAEKQVYGLLSELRVADRRKDEFLAMLAHELRGPLAPIANTLQILKRAEGDIEVLRHARSTLERQLAQMVRLVDDLLDVGRITRNKLELRKEHVELIPLVNQALEACRPLAESLNHEVSVNLPPEPIYLHGDPVRLAQVFSNLLQNACKYMEPGGRIWLNAERQGSDVVVAIKDAGIGIPAEMLPHIFEMFTQADRTLERSRGGLGIGLTLVKQLVGMHDGTVEASSDGPGRGSQFVVRLPILIVAPESQPAPIPVAEAHAAPSRRILVVDDNKDSAESLAELLKLTGHETRLAFDGLEAVEFAEQFRPELILLDIGLPKLNGFEACRRIREQSWGKTIVLVALTGWGQEEDRRTSIEAGFDHHMVKPPDFGTLLKLLGDLKATIS